MKTIQRQVLIHEQDQNRNELNYHLENWKIILSFETYIRNRPTRDRDQENKATLIW